MNDLVVLVLAGGSGKRFWPLSQDKILFPFLGKPLIEHTLGQSLPTQTSKLVVVTNEFNHALLSSLKFSVPHMTVIQKNARGMADAILSAENEIKNRPILIMIADDVVSPHLFQHVVDYGESHDIFGVLPGWKSSQYFPGGYFQFNDTKVTGIIEKPGKGNTPSDYINISGHFFRNSETLLEILKQIKSDSDDIYEQAVTQLMNQESFHILPYEENFLSLKYPWHVLSIMDELLKTVQDFRGDDVSIKNNVCIEGPVHIGSHVKIFENTKIVGPCYIGDNTIIGNNNVIRHSIVAANCVTGFNTDITRSYIGDSCWFHSNYIGDSVLEGNISMGSGSVLANLRLDEGEISSVIQEQKMRTERNKLGAIIGKDVRIGVNTSIMPGIKIGSKTCIGAGITVSQDIPHNSFVTGKTELIIEQNKKEIVQDRDEFKKKI